MKLCFVLVLVAFISSTTTLAATYTIRGSDTVVVDEVGEEFGRLSSTHLEKRGLGVGGTTSEPKKKREKGGEKEKPKNTKLANKENEPKFTKPSGGPPLKDGKPTTVKKVVTKDGKPHGATKLVKPKIPKGDKNSKIGNAFKDESKVGKFEKVSKDDGSFGAKPYGPW